MKRASALLLSASFGSLACGSEFSTGASSTTTATASTGHGGASSTSTSSGGHHGTGGSGVTSTGSGGGTGAGGTASGGGAGGAGGAGLGGAGGGCAPLLPLHAYDATPEGISAVSCNVDNILAADGLVAGLDSSGESSSAIDGVAVTGCILVDFGTSRLWDPVVIRARAAAKACSMSCSAPNCGKGDELHVFQTKQAGSYTFAKTLTITPSLTDQSLSFGEETRWVLVCRTGTDATRDDLEIDSIRSYANCP